MYSSLSKSTKPPEYNILVSPKGSMYFLDRSKKTIVMSHDFNSKLRHSCHGKVGAYIDVEIDRDGNIELYHHRSSSSSDSRGLKIKWTSREELETYAVNNFGNDIKFGYSTSHVKLFANSGKQDQFRIDMFKYMISEHSSTSEWYLYFTRYEVSFFRTNLSLRCHVTHTCSKDMFLRRCQMMKDYRFLDGSRKGISLEDIGLLSELNMEKISIDQPLEKLPGSNNVVSGKYLGFSVAIKTMKTTGIAHKKNILVSSNMHNNICRWFGGETKDNGDVLFAFERCRCTLYDYLFFEKDKAELQGVLRGVASAIFHLHDLDLGHGNLSPWTVLIANDGVPKLCGVEKCEKLTRTLRDEDLAGLGYVISYVFSFANESSLTRLITSEEKYYSSNILLSELHNTKNMEAYDMASFLVDDNSTITSLSFISEYIYSHPWQWNSKKKLDFFRDANDVLKQSYFSYLKSLNDPLKYPEDFNWKGKFPAELVTYMESQLYPNTYSFSGATNLIRFIRNIVAHRSELYRRLSKVASACVKNDDSLASYINTQFPLLLSRMYKELKKEKHKLPAYY